jgi:sulfur carrier protein ThiS
MNIVVSVRGNKQNLSLKEGASAKDAVNAADLHPSGTLVIRDGNPVPSDAPLNDGDELDLMPVASGG